MLRILLATTALATLGTAGAFAQDAQSQAQEPEANQEGESRLQLEAQQSTGAGTGQQITVNNGDTVVIQPDQSGTFTLHFQLGQPGAATTAPADTTTAQPGTPQDDLQQGDPEQLSTENLIGADVYGANEDNIGDVGDVLLSEEGEVDAMIVDVGGFLGIGSRQVAIGVDNLRFMVDNGGNWYVFTPFTQEQLEAQPEYNQQTYIEQREDQRLTAQQPAQEANQ